jgi:hypothetical protein
MVRVDVVKKTSGKIMMDVNNTLVGDGDNESSNFNV